MKNGRLVFLGTAPICIPFLEVLKEIFEIPLIVSQPDRPSGRNRSVCFSCVKAFALEHRISLLQPPSLSDPEITRIIRTLDPDIAVVIAYGQWIPPSIYKTPRHRTINVHFSLLPAYRGAAPVQRALQDGRTQTGISIFQLSSKMDAGPIWKQLPVDISPLDTTESLWQRMSLRGATLLTETVQEILSNDKKPVPQEERLATSAPILSKEEGRIDWNMPAQTIHNTLRAFTPWPGIFFQLGHRSIKVLEAKAVDFPHHCVPGRIHSISPEAMDVYCGAHSLLRITSLQSPGKNPMTPFCYSRGNPLGQSLE